jgi:hypothetical protein
MLPHQKQSEQHSIRSFQEDRLQDQTKSTSWLTTNQRSASSTMTITMMLTMTVLEMQATMPQDLQQSRTKQNP